MSFYEFFSNYPVLNDASAFSKKTVQTIREELDDALSDSSFKDKITIITTGSYGRGEASEASDLDFFVFFDSGLPDDVITSDIIKAKEVIERHVTKAVGSTGTFGADAIVKFSDLLQNIGGEKDKNQSLTRRILFLLEGTWLYGEDRALYYREELLKRYIKDIDLEKQISRFLLNDIIRYYRTITTDFEHKVTEDQKSWGLRNIKLRFSRKLLYFGGIISIAEISDIDRHSKITELCKILDDAILKRIYQVGPDNQHTARIFEIYQTFLDTISNQKNRELLDSVTKENRNNCSLFIEMRDLSKQFSLTLEEWLDAQYQSHPIHHALLF
ncbi:nucleotidyltransferase domain-containing protein [Pseudomonas sp. NPDC088414]|uniref:nucleotidyltransferase domain-containing protein n=1 Tax=Pseudomonas sp. NPDC088414 TaxID=3364454 RepID=UPI003811B2EA